MSIAGKSFRHMTQTEVTTARRQFRQFDLMNTGSVSTNELAALMLQLGGDGPEVDQLLTEVDSFGKRFTVLEFMTLLDRTKSFTANPTFIEPERSSTRTIVQSLDWLLLKILFLDNPKALKYRMKKSGKPVEWTDMDLVREPPEEAEAVTTNRPQTVAEEMAKRQIDPNDKTWQFALPPVLRQVKFTDGVDKSTGRVTPVICPFEEASDDGNDENDDDEVCFTEQDQADLLSIFNFYSGCIDVFQKGIVGKEELTRFVAECGLASRQLCTIHDFEAAVLRVKETMARNGIDAGPGRPPPGSSEGSRPASALEKGKRHQDMTEAEKKAAFIAGTLNKPPTPSPWELTFIEFKLVLRVMAAQVYPDLTQRDTPYAGIRKFLDNEILPSASREAFTSVSSKILAQELENPKIMEIFTRYRWPLKLLFDFYSDMDDEEEMAKLAEMDADAAGAAGDTMSTVEYLRFVRNFDIDAHLPLSMRLRAFRTSCYDHGPLAHSDAIEFTNFLHCLLRLALMLNPVADMRIQNCVTSYFPSAKAAAPGPDWGTVAELWGYDPHAEVEEGTLPPKPPSKWDAMKEGSYAPELIEADATFVPDNAWQGVERVTSARSAKPFVSSRPNFASFMSPRSPPHAKFGSKRLGGGGVVEETGASGGKSPIVPSLSSSFSKLHQSAENMMFGAMSPLRSPASDLTIHEAMNSIRENDRRQLPLLSQRLPQMKPPAGVWKYKVELDTARTIEENVSPRKISPRMSARSMGSQGIVSHRSNSGHEATARLSINDSKLSTPAASRHGSRAGSRPSSRQMSSRIFGMEGTQSPGNHSRNNSRPGSRGSML